MHFAVQDLIGIRVTRPQHQLHKCRASILHYSLRHATLQFVNLTTSSILPWEHEKRFRTVKFLCIRNQFSFSRILISYLFIQDFSCFFRISFFLECFPMIFEFKKKLRPRINSLECKYFCHLQFANAYAVHISIFAVNFELWKVPSRLLN
jgi:hypothetical protein